MKLFKVFAVVLSIVLVASVAMADPSDWAYSDQGYGKTITYKWEGSLTPYYGTNITTAATRWNETTTPVSASYSSSSSNTFQVGMGEFSGYTWYGLYTAHTNLFGTVTRFDIDINLYKLTLDGYDDTGMESTMAHEMGHGFALDDLEYGSQLMSHTRDRETIISPQDGDINGVNTIWN